MNAPAQSVIDGLCKNRERFEVFCRSLAEEELQRPVPPDNEWTVKDFVIHLLAFDYLTSDWVEQVMAGNMSGPSATADGGKFDIDDWNNKRVAEWRGKTLDEMFAASRPERARFELVLTRLTDEQMNSVVDFPGDNTAIRAEVLRRPLRQRG